MSFETKEVPFFPKSDQMTTSFRIGGTAPNNKEEFISGCSQTNQTASGHF